VNVKEEGGGIQGRGEGVVCECDMREEGRNSERKRGSSKKRGRGEE